jgi:hypothetical protein
MEVLNIVLSLVGLVFFVYLCSGAFLLARDSDRRHYLIKSLKVKYPDLTHEQIIDLAKIEWEETYGEK